MNYGGYFDFDGKEKRISELEILMNSPSFWDDNKKANEIITEVNDLKKLVSEVVSLKNKIKSNLELIEISDNEMKSLIESDIETINNELDNIETKLFLNGPYDKNDVVMEIHPGAGGTESCDWASMLFRMYTRWCDNRGYKYEIIDEQKGEEAGLKSVSLIIRGSNCYGYLRNEKGIHRLVRISPFDSGNRRHTSFASVDIIPFIDVTDINIEINPSDLRIDVYRSGGAGGQSVNTTDSAVRVTHLPTKIVVTVQNERSQLQNKEKALDILKSKLHKLEMDKQADELKNLKGELSDINFGNQIRSYVMHPYSMVKDHRTNIETSNVGKVMDGDLDIFINGNLKKLSEVE